VWVNHLNKRVDVLETRYVRSRGYDRVKTSARKEKFVSIQLERKDLVNTQQLEVAVNGPDGATHLILCTGIADLGTVSHETYRSLWDRLYPGVNLLA
jgi:hypothetical protein